MPVARERPNVRASQPSGFRTKKEGAAAKDPHPDPDPEPNLGTQEGLRFET